MGSEALATSFFESDSSADEGSILLARKQQRDNEAALADTGSPFASLGCFRTRPPLKKKPVLVVSDEELAEAHEAFETGAAALCDVDEPAQHRHVDFLGLSGMGADDDPEEDMGADVIDDLETGEDPAALLDDDADEVAETSMSVGRAPAKKSMALPPVSEEERQADIPGAEAWGEDERDLPAPFQPAPKPAPSPTRDMGYLLGGASDDDAEEGESAVASLFERMRQHAAERPAPEPEPVAAEPEPPSILDQMKRQRAVPEPLAEDEAEAEAEIPEPVEPQGEDDEIVSAEELLADRPAPAEDTALDLPEPGFDEFVEAEAEPAFEEEWQPPVTQEEAPPEPVETAPEAPVQREPRNSMRARLVRSEDRQAPAPEPKPQGWFARLWSRLTGRS